jgi:hypothetical protein
VIITQYFWPESFRINDLAVELKERGHDVTVLTGIAKYSLSMKRLLSQPGFLPQLLSSQGSYNASNGRLLSALHTLGYLPLTTLSWFEVFPAAV